MKARYDNMQTENIAEQIQKSVEAAEALELDKEEEARQAEAEVRELEEELLRIQAIERNKEETEKDAENTERQIESIGG